jgi:uncharacterized protein (DUF58 family)
MPINISQFSEKYSKLELLAKQVVEGFITGLHKSPFHGFSVEFAEHKSYNPGDSIKHIDWKLYGRTDKLFIKRFEEETNLRCQIVIDSSASMYYPTDADSKLKFSVQAAAVLMQMLKKQRDAVGVTIFNSQIVEHTQAKSSIAHQKRIYNLLENLLEQNNKQTTNTANALHQIAETVHKRSLIILFTDMMDDNSDELFDALQHLKHNKHEVILFHTLAKKQELDFEFSNKPYRFIDSETNEEIKLHPNQIKDAYQKQATEFLSTVKQQARQYKIDFVEVDINLGFDTVLTEYLVKRSKLY